MVASSTPSHCTADASRRCWECYSGFHVRTTERAIALAYSLLQLSVDDLALGRTEERVRRLQFASHLYTSMLSTQWREMTRQPFQFAQSTSPPPPPSPARPARKPNLDDL
jgi:hypothetical protein